MHAVVCVDFSLAYSRRALEGAGARFAFATSHLVGTNADAAQSLCGLFVDSINL